MTDLTQDSWPTDLEGWNSTDPVLAELILKIRPTRIVEA